MPSMPFAVALAVGDGDGFGGGEVVTVGALVAGAGAGVGADGVGAQPTRNMSVTAPSGASKECDRYDMPLIFVAVVTKRLRPRW
jgi:hypothetical protein